MNRPFVIIISITSVILLFLIIVQALLNRNNSSGPSSNQIAVPTGFSPDFSTGRTTRSPNEIETDSERQLAQLQNPSEEQEYIQLEPFRKASTTLPANTSSLEIRYSPLSNKMYVRKKNNNANTDFVRFLRQNQLTDLYQSRPDLFVITDSPLTDIIRNDEQRAMQRFAELEQNLGDDEETGNQPPSTSPVNARQKKRLSSLTNLFKSIYNVTLITPVPTQTPQQISTGTTDPKPTGATQQAPSNLSAGAAVPSVDTSNITCPAGLPTIGVRKVYAKGVGFYNIKLCNVHGFSINASKAKDFNDLFTTMISAGYKLVKPGGNFRTYETQAAGYKANPGAWAPPGSSNHERGLAVDLSCANANGSQQFTAWMTGKARGLSQFAKATAEHPCLNWVHNNSSRHGLLLQCDGRGANGEISPGGKGCETWHLSPTGH